MKYFYLITLLYLFACGKNSKSSSQENYNSSNSTYAAPENNEEENEEDEYSDGTWCADVVYYNPTTGTRNSYSLNVEVEDGELVQINWPNGGWLDESHFISEDISSGECSFTSDKGYEYTVTLESKGGC